MGTEFVESISGGGTTDLTITYAVVTSDAMNSISGVAGSYGDGSHVPVCSIDMAGRMLSYSSVPMVVIDEGGQAWNAFADKYGVKGNGDADDWPGLQQWINDGITSGKKLIMPPPPVTCLFSKPLLFNIANTYNESLGVSPAPLYLECQPGYNATGGGYALTYTGSSYQSALQFLGIQNGVIKGLTINIGGADPSVTNVVALDFVCTGALPNMGNLHLEDINILFQSSGSGSGSNCIGLRFGQSGRVVYDGAATNGSYTFMSATANFISSDIGAALIAPGIPFGATIQTINTGSSVQLSQPATADGSGLTTTIGGGLASNISGTHMVNFTVTDIGAKYGSIGCQIGGGEVVPFYAANCKLSELGCAWLVGGIQSLAATPLIAGQSTLPLQSALLFPTPGPGGSGIVVVGGGSVVAYTGKDVSSRSNKNTPDGVINNGSNILTSATLSFDSVYDVGATIYAPGVPVGTTIQTVNGPHSVTMSAAATATNTGVTVFVYRNILKDCTGVPAETNPNVTVQSVVPGQGIYPGGADTTWVGCSGGGNHWDFYFQNPDNSYRIFGGRWEGHSAYLGNHFLQTSTTQSGDAFNVLIEGVDMAGYDPPEDYPGVFVANAATTIRLVSSVITTSSSLVSLFGSNLFQYQGSWYYAGITIEDCRIMGTMPLWTVNTSAGTAIHLRNVQLTDVNETPISVVNMDVAGQTLAAGVPVTPGITAGPGAGTSPVISITGIDQAGTIALTAGTNPPTGADTVIFTVTFSNPFPVVPRAIILTPANNYAAALSGQAAVWENAAIRTAAGFTVEVGTAGLAASAPYVWNYRVIG